jgi:hypothetical protein
MDSVRWQHFPFRSGDIVISTPAKSGTTWTQMICALLVFQSPRLPRPLDAMSPWPDALMHRWSDVLATVEPQDHRRFMKTHTPLDGLPFRPDVTYVCVGRDPRDTAVSWDHHMANLDFGTVLGMRAAVVAGGAEDDPALPVLPVPPLPEGPPPPPRERFLAWMDSPEVVATLAAAMHHLGTFWAARHESNVVLLHYDDLRADLPGQMRALAARLGVDVPEQAWPELVRAATFEDMRARPELTPEKGIWIDPTRFFRRGTSGQWRDLLTEEDLRRYAARVAELADPELVAWVHRGPVAG